MPATRTVFIDTALSNYQSLATQYDASIFNVVLLNNASPHAEQIQGWMKSTGGSAADINIVSASASVNGSFTPRVVFVDSAVADLNTVIAGVPANATVVVLDATKDGIQQIKDYLAANAGQVGAIDIVTDLASVDVVSHGAPGEVTLGSTVLNAGNLANYSSQLAAIGSHLSSGGDILLYGCDVASGATGQQFISALASATGADVAASTDLTGSAAVGGDWVLEANTGTIETAALNISGYAGLLGNVTVVNGATLSADSGKSSTDYVTNVASQTVTFTGTINGGNGNTKVWVSTDGSGTDRKYVDVTVTGGTFTVAATLVVGAGRSIQFWEGNANQNNGALLFTRTYTLDQTAPTPTVSLKNDTGSSQTDGRTNDATLTPSTPETGATRTYVVDGNSATSTYDPSALGNGLHTLEVIDTDLAGNVGRASLTFTLDRTAPVVTASLANDTGSSPTDGKTKDASLTLSALENGATRSYVVDNGAATGTYNPATLSEGQHTVQVIDTDLAGNVGKSAVVSFTLDKTAPTVTASLANDTGSSQTDGKTKDAALTLSALENGATRTYSIDGGVATGTYNPASLSEGQHTVQVIDTDLAGNVGNSAVVSFTLDKTAPVVTASLANDTGSSPTDGKTKDATLTLSALENGATRTYSIDGGAATGTYTPATLSEGQHTVQVIDTDLAGNVGNSAVVSFTLDKTAPTVTASLANDTGSSQTDGKTKDASLTLSALEGGATRTYSIDGGAASSSYNPATLSEGEHTVQVFDTDLAGNVGNSAVISFTLDKTAPVVTAALANDTGASQTDGKTKDASLSLSALESGATRTYSIDGGAASSSYNPATLSEGEHTVQVVDTDVAGNVGNSAVVSFTLDKTAPVVTASLANDTGSSPTDGKTKDASLTLSALESGSTRTYSIDGGAATSSYNPATLSEGEHTVEVIDTDLAGNVGKSAVVAFVLDKTAPTVTALLANDTGSSQSDGKTSDASLTLSALESGATRTYSIDGGAASGSYNPATLTEGEHTVEVIDTDAAGNIGKSSAVTFTLDKTAPVVTASLANDTGSSQSDGKTSDASLTLSALESGATRTYSIDGGAASGSYNPATLSEGQHTVEVIDTDLAGNVGKSAVVAFVLDKTAPTVTASLANDTGASQTDGKTKDATLTLSALESGATRTYSIDGEAASSSYNPATLSEGEHTVQVIDTDLAGNVGKSAVVAFVLDKTAPVVTASLANDTGSSQSDGKTNDASLTLSALESGATRTYSIDGKAATGTYNPASLTEGEHTVQVFDTDMAGNVGTSAVVAFTLDKTAPTVTASLANDTGSSQTDGKTSDATLTLSALESDATRTYSIDGGAASSSYNPATLSEGEHTVEVIDTDAAGNIGKSSAVAFTLDKTAPVVTASLANDTGASQTDGKTKDASLTLSALESGATRTYSIDGKAATSSYNPATMSEGEHTVQVIDTDVAGNVGKSAVVTFVLDKTAPTVTASLANDTGSSQTDGKTSDAALTLSTLESGATRTYSIDGKAATGSYNPASLTEGEHTVQVFDTDVAGNVGTSAVVAFTLDKTAPTVTASLANDTGSSPSDGKTKDASLTLSALESGATRTYSIDGEAASSSYNPAMLTEGEHTVQVIDTDLAGNVGKSAVVAFVLDKTAPTVTASLANDTGSSQSDGKTNDASLTLSALESGATRTYSIDGGAASSSYNPATLTEGEHTVQVIDTDLAGNVGKSAVLAFVLDKTAPTVTASLANDTGSSQTDGKTSDATLTLSALESGATRTYSIDGEAASSSYNPATLSEGEHTVQVIDTDVAGNIGRSAVISFTLDKTAPVVTASLANDTGSSQSDGKTKDASLSLSALENGAIRTYSIDGGAASGSYNPATLSDGEHTVEVTDTDVAGNSKTAKVAFTLDTTLTAPTAKLANDSGTDGDRLTNKADLIFNSADGDAKRVIKVDDKEVTSYDPNSLAEGEHKITVTDTDAAGNTATVSTSFTLDSKGPSFTSAASASVAENIGENKLVYKAVAADPHGVSYTLAGADAAKFDIAADGSVTLKANPDFETVNAYGFTVVATDTAGNHTDQAVSLGITNVNEAPVATAISKSTIENAQITFQLADNVSDVDAGDKMAFSLGSTTASLSWANTDAAAPKTLINPVTKAVVDISTLSVKASLAADGSVTLTPPAELDWMATGQALKATFSYTVTDAAGLKSQDSIELIINGSTNDKGVNLSGGNGDDVMAGNATNNAEDVLMGNNGNDNLSGYGGTDALYGGNGDDKLSGGAGIDYLYGDNGNDTLDGGTEGDFIFGGKGNDLLTGGAGADKFVFAPQNGNDRITDFKLSEGDKLFFADFFSAPITVDAFLQKYVTDTGNDLQINLQGTTLTVVGVANASDLAGSIVFGMPA